MPRFFRVMLPEGDHPQIGSQKLMLGVRVGTSPKDDVELTERGTVLPETGGMSVAPHWKDLPYFLIPPRLGHLLTQQTKRRAASGNDEARCWRMGEGPFENASVNEQLRLRLETDAHGLVEPNEEVSIDSFQHSLAATRDNWVIEET